MQAIFSINARIEPANLTAEPVAACAASTTLASQREFCLT
jgi:hypothetical protein